MSISIREIRIIKLRKPKERDLNEELQWFSRSLGLFNERDKEKSCFRIFIQLLKHPKPMSSNEIASLSHLSRGTVIHHINRLLSSGLIIPENRKYILRDSSLKDIVSELRKDFDRVFDDIETIAKDLDKKLKEI